MEDVGDMHKKITDAGLRCDGFSREDFSLGTCMWVQQGYEDTEITLYSTGGHRDSRESIREIVELDDFLGGARGYAGLQPDVWVLDEELDWGVDCGGKSVSRAACRQIQEVLGGAVH